MLYLFSNLKLRAKHHKIGSSEIMPIIDSNMFKVEVDQLQYYSGEVIHGTVTFTPCRQFTLGSLSVELICEGHCVHVEEKVVFLAPVDAGASRATNEIHPYPRVTQHYKTTPITIMDGHGTEGILVKDVVNIPFKLEIPIGDYPSTLAESSHKGFPNYPSSVRHFLRFIMKGMNNKVILTKEVDVTIFSIYNYSEAQLPVTSVESVPIYSSSCCTFCAIVGVFSIVCSIDKSVYSPGEIILLTYDIETTEKNRKLLKKVKMFGDCQIVRNVLVLTGERDKTNKLRSRQYEEILHHQTLDVQNIGMQKTVSVPIPFYSPTCLPSTALQPNTTSWKYFIRLEIMLLSYCNDYEATAVIPFVVNGMSLREMSHLKYAVPVKPLPENYSEDVL